jgi:hypothetical protein
VDPRSDALVQECTRQEESCLYTSTSLYIWLRDSRSHRRIFVVAPIVIGAIAVSPLLDRMEIGRAILVMVASLFPAVFEALKLDIHIDTIAKHAAAYKSLQDRFRQARTVTALGSYEEFRTEFDQLMVRMDATRESSLTPPERCFTKAQEKIKAGHYDFEADKP